MTLDKATIEGLRDIVEGRTRHPALNPVTKRMVEILLFCEDHKDELDALTAAEAGNPGPLAALIETEGHLRTADARAYVAARVRGDSKTRSKDLDNVIRRIRLWIRVIELTQKKGVTQSAALRLCLDDAATDSFDSIRSDFNRGDKELRELLEIFGFRPGPAFNSKHEENGSE